MLRVYDSRLSGNAWKVRILLNQLGRPFERVTLDLESVSKFETWVAP
jgi:glutathione S-transferase